MCVGHRVRHWKRLEPDHWIRRLRRKGAQTQGVQELPSFPQQVSVPRPGEVGGRMANRFHSRGVMAVLLELKTRTFSQANRGKRPAQNALLASELR